MWRDGVAQALAHLAALAVGGKAVGQQAFVGRAVVQSAAQQQRAVEPAAVLVVTFQIQISFWALVVMRCTVVRIFVATAQHVLEGRARVKPNFQDVGALGVAGCVVAGLVEDVFHRHAAPCFDAAFFNDVGRLVHDGHGAWVQLAAVFVQEERHGHTPAALARDAPVGAVGNHVAQTCTAVFWVEVGFVNRVQREFAQRLA